MIKMGSFRSYVGLEEYDETKVPPPLGEAFLQPNFVNGELVIAEAHQVLKFTTLAKKTGISGSLFVTNARLVFVSSDHVSQDSVPLLSIHTLCHYEDEKSSLTGGGRTGNHRVKLTPHSSQQLFYTGSTRIYELLVICSNFRTLSLSFKFSPIDQGKKICNALLHHAIPDPLERLFYFDYCKKTPDYYNGYNKSNIVPYLDVALDWHKELKTSRTPAYRVSEINDSFNLCETLPEWIVVPAAIDDSRLTNLAEKLKGSRPPFWVWGDSRGSAIIRMGKLHNEADSILQNSFFELLRKSHPQKMPPNIVDLEGIFPVKEIKQSFNRLLELCCPESLSQFKEFDSRFLSLLEHTRWLSWVSKVLQTAGSIAETLATQSVVVILQEHESRDVSCLISSIIQLIMEPRFRTAIGFFSLIQKDWVATGHPFHSGYLHTSPVFLLFLDVVYQLCTQNPFQFEFNDTLLLEIWDSNFDATSGTFMFDSPKQRKNLELRKDLSIWHRVLQKDVDNNSPKDADSFAERVSMVASKSFLFPSSSNHRNLLINSSSVLPQVPRKLINPMYKVRLLLHPPSSKDGQSNSNQLLLSCSSTLCDIQLWSSLYLSRTADETLTIGARHHNKDSSPVPLLPEEIYFPTTPAASTRTRNSSSSSGNSLLETTSFITNQTENSCRLKSGPDPEAELKLVDALLATLTTTNRYHRNPQSSGNSANRPINSRVLRQGTPHSHSSTSSGLSAGKGRRNPFSTHL